jgi:hypothetical protein
MEDLGTGKVRMGERMGRIDGSVSARYFHGTRMRLMAGFTELWEAALATPDWRCTATRGCSLLTASCKQDGPWRTDGLVGVATCRRDAYCCAVRVPAALT